MMRHMHRALMALGALAATTLASACGGGKHQQSSAPTPPVIEQVRQALLDSLKIPALPDMTTDQHPLLPYTAVGACVGPTGGGAGRYQCATTPRGRRGVRSITVQVRGDGEWSTQPLTVWATLHGRRTTAATSLWGTGIHIPG
jgi:hypothetical protein